MKKYSAPLLWTIALLVLFFMDPAPGQASLCIFKWMGFNSCWGCGIGGSMHHALHLQLEQSWHKHILGIPAVLGILYSFFHSFIPPKQITAHGPTADAYDVA